MTIKVSLGPSASSSLIGTIGSSTVEVNQKTKVVAFVRAPTQLGGGAGPQQQQDTTQQQQIVSCATGEVVLTLVRAPFAFSRVHADNNANDTHDDDFLLQKQLETQKQLQSTILSGPSSLVTQHQEASSLLQMIRKALDKSILKEALPLARFDLVVQILSSVNDDDDFRGITTAACAALLDANIPLKDVFGAACSSSSSSSSSIRMIVAGHSQSILGMQISNHFNNNNNNNTNNVENICQGIEECTSRCVKETLESLRLAAAEKISRNKTNTTTSKK